MIKKLVKLIAVLIVALVFGYITAFFTNKVVSNSTPSGKASCGLSIPGRIPDHCLRRMYSKGWPFPTTYVYDDGTEIQQEASFCPGFCIGGSGTKNRGSQAMYNFFILSALYFLLFVVIIKIRSVIIKRQVKTSPFV